MRTVICPGLGRPVSALGFGCAALGSRISEAHSRRVLDYAFDRGVTWFDVAPRDGAGEAEAIVGPFLAGRRDKIVICARIGVGRPSLPPWRQALGALKRSALNAFPELSALTRGRLKPKPDREALRPELVETSIVESLRRLRTDYIDVLALQDPDLAESGDPALRDALQLAVDKGYVRALAVEGEPEAIEAATAAGAFPIVQVRHNPFHRTIERVRAMRIGDAAPFCVLRRPLGGGAYERLSHLLVGDGGRLASLASQLAYGPPFMASEILLDYAFGNNPTGVVLVSMSQPPHVDLNCARASRPPRTDVVEFVNKTVLTAPAARFSRLA